MILFMNYILELSLALIRISEELEMEHWKGVNPCGWKQSFVLIVIMRKNGKKMIFSSLFIVLNVEMY